MDPLAATFELFAVGPIFPEQPNLDAHRKYRDIVAPLEAALARHLTDRGFVVVGTHSSKHPFDRKLFSKVLRSVEKLLLTLPAQLDGTHA
jgi:hypothetical protein